MKKLFTLSVLTLALAFTSVISAQEFSGLDKSPMDAASFPSSYRNSDKKVRIVYSRPQLKGRSVSSLAKPGEVWRTGANEAPEITFYENVNFGGKDIKAGTYALLTIPGEKEWTVILHKSLNEWGAYFYKDANDVARIKVKATTGSEALEAFSIAFAKAGEGANMVMGWGTTRVAVPITFKMMSGKM